MISRSMLTAPVTLPFRVEQRSGVGANRTPAAVRALCDRLCTAHGLPSFNVTRHRTLIVRQGRAVGPIQPPCHAPLIAAEFRHATRELHRGLVEVSDFPVRIVV